jgi:hypothetical protein
MQPYSGSFDVGSKVRIVHLQALEDFLRTWRYHNQLRMEQLAYAGRTARIAKVGFYHGGEPLYELDEIPGVWHEVCLCGAEDQNADSEIR